jgi:hypothetical protein
MEGFGPSSNWKVDHVQLIFPIPPILEFQKDPIILSCICGPKKHETIFEDNNIHSL